MLYASLKAIHLLAVIVWVGGMFFTLMCLRPAVHEVLEAPARVRADARDAASLPRGSSRIAALAVLVSGAAMIALVWRDRARAPAWPSTCRSTGMRWSRCSSSCSPSSCTCGCVAVPARRAGDDGRSLARRRGAALGAIRWEVAINLVLGIFIVVMVRLGASA